MVEKMKNVINPRRKIRMFFVLFFTPLPLLSFPTISDYPIKANIFSDYSDIKPF